MKMAIGSDSTGSLTDEITSYLESKGIELMRCGALKGTPADYVDGAHEVAQAVASGESEQGLIFGNTGAGVSIVANKVAGVRAAMCVEPYAAKIARLANNANVIILSIRMTGEPLAKDILDTWLETAARSPDQEERVALYSQVQLQVMDQALVIPIRDYVNLNGVSNRVQELRFDAQGWFPWLIDVTLETE